MAKNIDLIEQAELERIQSETAKNKAQERKLNFEADEINKNASRKRNNLLTKNIVGGCIAAGLLAVWAIGYLTPIIETNMELNKINQQIQADSIKINKAKNDSLRNSNKIKTDSLKMAGVQLMENQINFQKRINEDSIKIAAYNRKIIELQNKLDKENIKVDLKKYIIPANYLQSQGTLSGSSLNNNAANFDELIRISNHNEFIYPIANYESPSFKVTDFKCPTTIKKGEDLLISFMPSGPQEDLKYLSPLYVSISHLPTMDNKSNNESVYEYKVRPLMNMIKLHKDFKPGVYKISLAFYTQDGGRASSYCKIVNVTVTK